MNLQEEMKQQEQEAIKQGIVATSDDYYKFVEGENAFRALTKPDVFYEKFKVGVCYTDCGFQGSPRFMLWVLDRKDNAIKLATVPSIIAKTIAGYQTDEDYAFDSFPMPYDIKVNAKGAGTKEVEYTITPRAKRDEVEAWVTGELKKKNPTGEIIERKKEKQKQRHIDDGTWDKMLAERAALKAELDPIRDAAKASEERKDSGPIRKVGKVYPLDDLDSERMQSESEILF